MRIGIPGSRMKLREADALECFLRGLQGVRKVTVHERTGSAIIFYGCQRTALIDAIRHFHYDDVTEDLSMQVRSREMTREYTEKLVMKITRRYLRKLFLPAWICRIHTLVRSVPYIWRGIRCLLRGQLRVELLDALSIGISLLRGDFSTASSVRFLLEVGDLLDEWTHKKTVDDLARTMSLNIDKVWVKTDDGTEVLLPLAQVQQGDRIVVRMGSMIPIDGVIESGQLMVDFSCALKLAMPLAVLSAMREAGDRHITVKGGKFLETVANADMIVFDKTGTLTHACPRMVRVVPFAGNDEKEMLRIAACLEEHFPHSMANAVVQAAREQNLQHEELHTQVEYIVAHGIRSTIAGQPALIGSAHFVFEDEGVKIPRGEKRIFNNLPDEYSHLYLAIGGKLAAVICIADPLREEAKAVMETLHTLGIRRLVMLTGDSERTAAAIAREVGVDEYRAEVLPEDKAKFVEQARAEGHTVIMIGDGINDAPALSAANVGIAVSNGAAVAREVADITITSDDLQALVVLRRLAAGLMARIRRNYHFIMSFNGSLIALGSFGILPPATSAMLHNGSTIAISLQSMTNLLPPADPAAQPNA